MNNVIDFEDRKIEKEVEKDMEILKKKINGIPLTNEERKYIEQEQEKRDLLRKNLKNISLD